MTTRSADVIAGASTTLNVKWSEGQSGLWHNDAVGPGETKSFSGWFTNAGLNITITSGPADYSVKDTGTVALSAKQTITTPIAIGDTVAFTDPAIVG